MPTHYRVGIIGCGNIAQRHAKAYKSVPGMDLVAGAEPHAGAGRAFQEAFAIPAMYATPEEMLRKESLDVVSICTWHLLHAPQTILAADHGVRSVLCEKPMAVRLAEADRMIAACAARRTKLAIGHQRRFYPGWTEARRQIAQGAIGQPVLVTGTVIDGLLNTGSHVVDGIRYVLGDPQAEWVMGALERKTDRWERDVPIEDCCMGLMAFAGGAQGLIQVDLTARNEPDHMTVQGTEGMLRVGPEDLRLFSVGHTDGEARPVPWDHEVEDAARSVGLEGFFLIAYTAQTRALKAWLDAGGGYRSDGPQTRHAVELMMALTQSARNHEVVRLPLAERDYPVSQMIAEGKLPLRYPERYDIRGPERRTWIHREKYDRLRAAGLPHPQIVAEIFKRDPTP